MMKRSILGIVTLFAVLAMVFAVAAPVAASPQAGKSGRSANGVYIVEMLEQPVVAYDGGIPGYPATQPKTGQKIDPLSNDVVKYVGYLNSRHDAALKSVGAIQKLYDYSISFNGFAAQLTDAQAAKMAGFPGVLNVTPDQVYTMDTSSTWKFLGLDAPGGLWEQLGGIGSAGDGIIIGMIDSGIWPESPSFSDRTGFAGKSSQYNQLTYQQIPGWHGKCTPGEAFNASMCNQKLIGAQWFDASWGGDAGLKAQRPWEFASARDYNGHGTHTSSTAGGNNGIQATGPASVFGKISGMAPHARIAMYKALWSTQDASLASGSTSDLLAAINQAVADGVDVINYSISGTLTNFADPVEIAYLYAARAGIFVAESAGNSGPTPSTVAHPAPWTTTVAAGTHNRNVVGTVTLGNSAVYTGVSTAATAAGPAPLINSTAAGLSGADPDAVRLCYSTATNGGTPALDPAVVAGKIVVCERGTNARVDKSLAVKEAGGVGMVLVNTSAAQSLNADFHSVPTVHLKSTYRMAIETYAATAGATATISKASIVLDAPAPYTAAFSSRGPLLASGDLLKPDLIAPGQDILAAVAPPGNGGLNFNLYSGTSMSSPHVAGLAALLKQLHPTWTPMMIKSALMTSAYDVLDGPDTDPTVIFSQGAGHVKPNSAADPGLVFDSGWNNWLAFLCGTTNAVAPASCTALKGMGYSTDPSDFNSPSIAIAELAGSQTVTRTVTNVGVKGTYNVTLTGLTGINVQVSPASFTLNPGQKQTLQITFTQDSATLNDYSGGYLTWADGTHSVRIPLVIKPVALSAPVEVSGTGAAINYNVIFGYNGTFTATARGLIPATTFSGSVMTDPTGAFTPVEDAYTKPFTVTVPAGSTYARFSLFDANVLPAGSDLDLYVYDSGGNKVGESTSGTADEEVDLLNPAADTYTVWVHGYATGNPSTFTLFTWVLGTANAGNMTVTAPSTAVLAGTGTISLSFSGLTSGTKYLGSVVYGPSTDMPAPTIVRVDP